MWKVVVCVLAAVVASSSVAQNVSLRYDLFAWQSGSDSVGGGSRASVLMLVDRQSGMTWRYQEQANQWEPCLNVVVMATLDSVTKKVVANQLYQKLTADAKRLGPENARKLLPSADPSRGVAVQK